MDTGEEKGTGPGTDTSRDQPERGGRVGPGAGAGTGRGALGVRADRPDRGVPGARRAVVAVLLLLGALTVAWWGVVRVTASTRAVTVHGEGAVSGPADVSGQVADASGGAADGSGGVTSASDRATDTIRVLAWNIAHVRGDGVQGWVQNFRGGGRETRAARLSRIAAVIRWADADVVVLNEVDFDAAWSGGVNQARALAESLGYGVRVEQRNFDYSLLFADFAFGNAVLTRLPVRGARRVPLPPLSGLEAVLIGAKTAAAVEVGTRAGPVTVVPIHLEFRDAGTRRAAVAPLTALRDDTPPLLLAGDFNTSPPGWPGAGDTTAVGALLTLGLRSPRAERAPTPDALTFPSPAPRRAIDWVLAEPPLRVLEARVLGPRTSRGAIPGGAIRVLGVRGLSDHLPVLAVVEVSG